MSNSTLKREVSNEEFTTAYEDKDNQAVMDVVKKKFANKMRWDDLECCAQEGLFYSLQTHIPDKMKFTSYLYQNVRFKILDELNDTAPKIPTVKLDSNKCQSPSSGVMEILDGLTPEYRDIVEKRVFGGMTFEEISKTTSLGMESIRLRYEAAIQQLRTSFE